MRRKIKNRRRGLFGVDEAHKKQSIKETAINGTLVLLSAIAAGGAGAAIGKHSFIAGLPVAFFGIYKKNHYITAAGLGLVLSNGFQPNHQNVSAAGIGALDMKDVAQEAKDRVTTFFKNFSDKLYLPTGESSTTEGFGDNGEQVTYFVNPYSQNELDMSAIDRIQEQIAHMNQPISPGLNDFDKEL